MSIISATFLYHICHGCCVLNEKNKCKTCLLRTILQDFCELLTDPLRTDYCPNTLNTAYQKGVGVTHIYACMLKYCEKKCGLQNRFCLFTFWPVTGTLKYYNGLIAINMLRCPSAWSLHHTAVPEVPGSIPDSNKSFNVFLLLFCFYILVQNHYLSWKILILLKIIFHLVYLTYCKSIWVSRHWASILK